MCLSAGSAADYRAADAPVRRSLSPGRQADSEASTGRLCQPRQRRRRRAPAPALQSSDDRPSRMHPPGRLPLRESRARASHHHRVSCRELRTAASPLAARTPPGDIARTRHALYPFDSPAGSRSCRPQKRRVRVGPVVLPPAPGPATRSTLPLLEIHESRSC